MDGWLVSSFRGEGFSGPAQIKQLAPRSIFHIAYPLLERFQMRKYLKIDTPKPKCKIYLMWRSMLDRCNSDTAKLRNPSYQDCSVCEEWLNFDNFKSWVLSFDYEGKQLDKDLIDPVNRVYSPSKCILVSGAVNSFMIEPTRGLSAPLGSSFNKRYGTYGASCRVNGRKVSLGTFKTPNEANYAWKKAKYDEAVRLSRAESDSVVAELLVSRYLKILKGGVYYGKRMLNSSLHNKDKAK